MEQEQGGIGAAPAPRRTSGGREVLVGPSVGARYRPGVLIGLPLVSLVLSPFAAAGLQQWRYSRLQAGLDGVLEELLAPAWSQLLLGALLLWLLFALWGLVPILLTHRMVLFEERSGRLALRRGLRIVDRAELGQVEYAVGEPERGGMALIGVRRANGPSHTSEEGGAGPVDDVRQWIVPEIGWDAGSFDGLRLLQSSAGLTPAPPRAVLRHENRQRRRADAHRELADRLGMPWREEYAEDEAAFQAEFDRVRRVLGGKEPRREGDPAP